jgi:hypothetical protein
MRETHVNRYVPGTYWRECDVCGFDMLRKEMLTRYDGLIVCPQDWEPKPRSDRKRSTVRERPLRRD